MTLDKPTNSIELMADRTTITVSKETKDTLDQHRGDRPWDLFLRSLIQSNSSGGLGVTLTSSSVNDVAAETAKRTADELEARLR